MSKQLTGKNMYRLLSTSVLLMLLFIVSCSDKPTAGVADFPTYVEQDGVSLRIETAGTNPLPKPLPTITFVVPHQGHVKLTLNNATGYEIKVLFDEYVPPGFYDVQYDITNENGDTLKTGIYIFELVFENHLYLQLQYFLL